MASAAPQFRNDLAVTRQGEGDNVVFIVKDPRSGKFCRFGEQEHFICRQLDGATELKEIQRRFAEAFGEPIDREELKQFVKDLEQQHLLFTDDLPPAEQPFVRGSLLYLRFKAFDPDRLLNRLLPSVRFFFTPTFVATSAILIALAMAVVVFEWERIFEEIPSLFSLDILLFAWVITLCVITLHEFAHGFTCKHFGGEVHEMGFMLVYFQPALYANVSDAWMMAQKSQKLWISFAGAYFELFIWSLATILWSATDFGNWLHTVSLVIMASSGIKTLFNFVPLIKLDGYYLLSDYLEIANLRKRAFGYVGARLGGLWRSGPTRLEEVSTRERRIFIAYGVIAGIYTLSSLSVITAGLGGVLVDQFEAAGFVAASGLISLIAGKRLRRFFPGWKGPVQHMKNAKLLPAIPHVRWLLLGGFIAVPTFVHLNLRVGGDFRILPERAAEIRTQVAGIVAKIEVKEGQRLAAGDPVARISDRDNQAELGKTGSDITQTQARVQMSAQKLAKAKVTVKKIEEQLDFARKNAATMQRLLASNAVSQKEYNDAKLLEIVREKELQEMHAELKVTLDEMSATQAEIAKLQVQHNYLGGQIELSTLSTPIAGIVTTPSRRLDEKRGQFVNKGDLIAEVHQLDTVIAEIVVSEQDVADIQIGQTVELKARAFPEDTFYGKVIQIGAALRSNSVSDNNSPGTVLSAVAPKLGSTSRGEIIVRTRVANPNGLLKPEMTGKVKIVGDDENIWGLVQRRLARTFWVQVWSWW